ncbi:ArsS family sensor histidine kinase [Sulfuricurvum sp.]|uniref:ArsS family sensor histidine kinase n=1 Tax=Sulfuricurvum sp. TaxID=2025608 RepID=UPI003569066C
MVKNNAVLATVLFAFVVTVASVSTTFYQLYEINRAKHIDSIFAKHSLIAQIYHTYLLKQISQPMFEANLALYDLYEVREGDKYKRITGGGDLLKQEGKSSQDFDNNLLSDAPYAQIMVSPIASKMIEYQGKIYFLVESTHNAVLLEDRGIESYNPVILLSAYFTLLSVLLISFALIIHRLRPLRRLRKQIARFGEGDMGVSFRTSGSDEIALIANELDTTQNKIRSLIESRTLFLRNIMHELKTPIAKGRIAATMLSEEKQQGRFLGIFERLESLIGEFALIEEITSGNQHLEKNEYRLIDIIDGAIDSAMVEYDSVSSDIDASVKIEVDYRLFVTAVKNLIDNAIKYSPEKKMSISMENNEIVFTNFGPPLKKPLSYYIEPFTKDQPTKDSFGLGLYIVDAILREHDYILAYERRNDLNCFIFVPVKPTKRSIR